MHQRQGGRCSRLSLQRAGSLEAPSGCNRGHSQCMAAQTGHGTGAQRAPSQPHLGQHPVPHLLRPPPVGHALAAGDERAAGDHVHLAGGRGRGASEGQRVGGSGATRSATEGQEAARSAACCAPCAGVLPTPPHLRPHGLHDIEEPKAQGRPPRTHAGRNHCARGKGAGQHSAVSGRSLERRCGASATCCRQR